MQLVVQVRLEMCDSLSKAIKRVKAKLGTAYSENRLLGKNRNIRTPSKPAITKTPS